MLRIAAYVWNLSLKTIQWKIPLLLFQLCSVKQKLIQGRVNFQVILWKYCLDFTVVRHIFVSITVDYIHYQINLLNRSFNHCWCFSDVWLSPFFEGGELLLLVGLFTVLKMILWFPTKNSFVFQSFVCGLTFWRSVT